MKPANEPAGDGGEEERQAVALGSSTPEDEPKKHNVKIHCCR